MRSDVAQVEHITRRGHLVPQANKLTPLCVNGLFLYGRFPGSGEDWALDIGDGSRGKVDCAPKEKGYLASVEVGSCLRDPFVFLLDVDSSWCRRGQDSCQYST